MDRSIRTTKSTKISCVHFVLFVAIFSVNVVTAKEWRGIVPLKSTRADVERVFGVGKPSWDWISYYKLSDAIVVFNFQSGECDPHGLGWNVAPGTVVRISVIPTGTHRREEYPLASDSKIDDNGTGLVYYSDYTAGLTVETHKNRVTLVDYYPEATKNNMRCPRIQECCVDFFHRFDEYESISFEDEKARLDNFMIHMSNVLARGTIEVLGPSRRARQQLMKRAARAKRYLVNERAFEAERILLIDGGFRERPMIRLSLYAMGGEGSRIILFPEKDPDNKRNRRQ